MMRLLENKKPLNILVLLVLFIVLFYFSFNYEILDSDSGREIKRALNINNGGYDGGPFTTQILYSILISVSSVHNSLMIIKFLNVVLFFLTIIFSIKSINLLDSKKRKNLSFFSLLFFFGVFPIFYLLFFIKPFLLPLFLFSIFVYYLLEYQKTSHPIYLVTSYFALSLCVVSKNHALPFLLVPAIITVFEILKGNKKSVIWLYPYVFLLLPITVYQFLLSGVRFWHYPNSWYFTDGLHRYIVENFWNYPNSGSLSYYAGQFNFYTMAIPFFVLLLISIIHFSFRKDKLSKSLIGIFIVSLFPYVLGVIPFYSQYMYFVCFISIILISIFLNNYQFNKGPKILIITTLSIFLILLFIQNITLFTKLSSDSSIIIEEFREFKDNYPTHKGNIYAREFKLQPYSENKFISIDELNGEEAVRLLTTDTSEKEMNSVLKGKEICFVLFYKDRVYNEVFYGNVAKFLNKEFNKDYFDSYKNLKKVYDGNELLIYQNVECQNETSS